MKNYKILKYKGVEFGAKTLKHVYIHKIHVYTKAVTFWQRHWGPESGIQDRWRKTKEATLR